MMILRILMLIMSGWATLIPVTYCASLRCLQHSSTEANNIFNGTSNLIKIQIPNSNDTFMIQFIFHDVPKTGYDVSENQLISNNVKNQSSFMALLSPELQNELDRFSEVNDNNLNKRENNVMPTTTKKPSVVEKIAAHLIEKENSIIPGFIKIVEGEITRIFNYDHFSVHCKYIDIDDGTDISKTVTKINCFQTNELLMLSEANAEVYNDDDIDIFKTNSGTKFVG